MTFVGEHRWNNEELLRDFTVIRFMAPYVLVVRKSDGVRGTLEFTHRPRVYFKFQPAVAPTLAAWVFAAVVAVMLGVLLAAPQPAPVCKTWGAA
jgi:hypothetical protein